jgi:tRNA(Ile)-lysidine synthase
MNQATSENALSNDIFISTLKSYPAKGKYWIACSGGMDSSVLLHLFYAGKSLIKQSLEVIYVNHGLQEKSLDWGEFCKRQCQQYGLPFLQVDLKEDCPKGMSIEEWAREKRYTLIAERMMDQDILFTGHHQDDQVETFFLQALRSAGPRGLASMPSIKKFANGFHARPLLMYPRRELQRYANDNKLDWHEDNSNTDTRYDRNYLRHKILPEIEARWPAYRESISRLIKHQKEYKLLLDEIAQDDMTRALHDNTMCLKLDIVRELSIVRQKNLIFIWLAALQLNSPGSKHLDNIISELINVNTEKSPCVNWNNVEVRRYKNLLYSSEALVKHNVNTVYDWDIKEPITILDETLIAKPKTGKGLSKVNTKNAKFVIRYRQGGEKIHPTHHAHSKTVKQLFQECGVLPWLRDRIPLVYINETLAVIPGFCVDKKYSAAKDESSWDIQWSGYDKVIQ